MIGLETRAEILRWLKEDDPEAIRRLLSTADRVRALHVGDQVHFRGLIELSNLCRRACSYCGIRAPNRGVIRYRLTREEILAAADTAREMGFGTVTLQSGEDPALNLHELCETIRLIKQHTRLAVTLSIGERSRNELARLRDAGADRYLLRFETSNSDLYNAIHPPIPGQINHDRFDVLRWLDELGYEIGSGIMVGIPGETYDDLARDLELFRELNLDMIGLGPYIPHPETPMGRCMKDLDPPPDQTPNSLEMTLKVLAITRLICPDVNLPSTTALETLTPDNGYENGLACGANVIMPNLTPVKYRALYEIYPGKAGQTRMASELMRRMIDNLRTMGRKPAIGPGKSTHYLLRHAADGKGVETNGIEIDESIEP
ncbi:[FeFe] hydrogenase H-cluster radical SAM maturase HydE [bacterium]|nr:[FeFe] hydrogenase H-cluster radical SAM maturase HydE [candidate division CSSED10-310 bacterium]